MPVRHALGGGETNKLQTRIEKPTVLHHHAPFSVSFHLGRRVLEAGAVTKTGTAVEYGLYTAVS